MRNQILCLVASMGLFLPALSVEAGTETKFVDKYIYRIAAIHRYRANDDSAPQNYFVVFFANRKNARGKSASVGKCAIAPKYHKEATTGLVEIALTAYRKQKKVYAVCDGNIGHSLGIPQLLVKFYLKSL